MINYYLDGPCGNCPKAFTCNINNCIHWIAWEEVLATIRKVAE